jgi:hypothetical protein
MTGPDEASKARRLTIRFTKWRARSQVFLDGKWVATFESSVCAHWYVSQLENSYPHLYGRESS